jgi:hypothetical protein
LDGHRSVLVEMRGELSRNVSVRETVEDDLRRVEGLSLEMDAELRKTQGALDGSVKERVKVTEELEKTTSELGGERETQAFLREELSSRWKNFVRAVWPVRRKY